MFSLQTKTSTFLETPLGRELSYILQTIGKLATPNFMTCTSPVQPQIPVGLNDQRSILNQLYQLALNTTMSHAKLERT